MRPHLPVQTNPNPNNKVVQHADILNMPALTITHVPCDEIQLLSGGRIKPIIKDVASSKSDKECGEFFFVEILINHEEVNSTVDPIVNIIEPPFPKLLELSKSMELTSFNLLG